MNQIQAGKWRDKEKMLKEGHGIGNICMVRELLWTRITSVTDTENHRETKEAVSLHSWNLGYQ